MPLPSEGPARRPSDSLRSRGGGEIVGCQRSCTIILSLNKAQFTVWSRDDGTPFPNLNSEPDPDDLCPEEILTKQFWKTLYWNIEQWRKEKEY